MSYALGAVGAPKTQRGSSTVPDASDTDIPPYDKRRPGESMIPSERAKQRDLERARREAEEEFEDLLKRPRRTAPPERAGPRMRRPLPRVYRRPVPGPGPIGGSVILIPEILKEAVKVMTRKLPEPGIRTVPRRQPPPPPETPPQPRTQPERPEPVPEVRPPQVMVPRPLPEPPQPPVPQSVEFPTPTPSVPSGLPAPSTATAPAPISPLPLALVTAGLGLLLRTAQDPRASSQNVTLPGDVPLAQPEPEPMPEPETEPAPVGSPAISPLPAPAPLPKTQPQRLTPSITPQVCYPDPASCRAAKEKRKKERDEKCNAFIKIPVRAHKKAVCVQDLAKYLLRKFKSKANSRVREELKKHGIVLVKRPRKPKLPDIEVGGGVEIDLGDLIKGK